MNRTRLRLPMRECSAGRVRIFAGPTLLLNRGESWVTRVSPPLGPTSGALRAGESRFVRLRAVAGDPECMEWAIRATAHAEASQPDPLEAESVVEDDESK